MKKILFIILLLIPFMVKAADNVKITDIDELEKSDGVTVNNEPTFEGLKINYDFKFSAIGDFIKYKVTIKNEDTKEYEIESGVKFSEGEYIKYEFGLNGESAIIKPNEEKEMTLQITYVKEPSPDKFVDGKYVEQNAMSVDLSSKEAQNNAEAPNPKTGSKGIILLIAILLGALLLICFFEKKNAFFLIALFLLVPITIHAIEKISIEIETKIEIAATEKEGKLLYSVCSIGNSHVINFKFTKGIKMSEYAKNPNCYSVDDYLLGGCVEGLSHAVPVKKEYEACIAELSRPYEGSMPAEEYQNAYADYLNHMNECLTENAVTDKTSYDINEEVEDFYLLSQDEAIYVYCDNVC